MSIFLSIEPAMATRDTTFGPIVVAVLQQDPGEVISLAGASQPPQQTPIFGAASFFDVLTFVLAILMAGFNVYFIRALKNGKSESFRTRLFRMQKYQSFSPDGQLREQVLAMHKELSALREILRRMEQRPSGDTQNVDQVPHSLSLRPSDGAREKPATIVQPAGQQAPHVQPVGFQFSRGADPRRTLEKLEKYGRSIEGKPHDAPEFDQAIKTGLLNFFIASTTGELRMLSRAEWVRDKQWMFGVENKDTGQILLFFDRGLAHQKLAIQKNPADFAQRLKQVFEIEIDRSGVPRVISPAVVMLEGERIKVLERGRGSF